MANPVAAAAGAAVALIPVAVSTATSFVGDAVKSVLGAGDMAPPIVRTPKVQPVAPPRGRFGRMKESIYQHAWSVLAATDMATRMLSAVESKFGVFAHAISVTAQGGPQASLRRVWYLCLAAAFGRLRNRVLGLQACNIEATWDVTGKSCSVTIGYRNSGFVSGTGAATGIKSLSPLAPFHRGPDQVTVGGSWPSFLTSFNVGSVTQNTIIKPLGGLIKAGQQLIGDIATLITGDAGASSTRPPGSSGSGDFQPIPAIPLVYETGNLLVPEQLVKFFQSYGTSLNLVVEMAQTQSGNEILPWSRVLPVGLTISGSPYKSIRSPSGTLLPVLPDDGRIITTGVKIDPRVQNPRPPLDGKSRCSLVSLVAQVLSAPGLLPASPPIGPNPLNGPGMYVYPPGQGLDKEELKSRVFDEAADRPDVALPAAIRSLAAPQSATVGPDGYPLQQVIPNVQQR